MRNTEIDRLEISLKSLAKLIGTVFIISWAGVLPSLLLAYGVQIPESLTNLQLLMTLGPLVGAIFFIYQWNGIYGLKNFFRKLLQFRAILPVWLVVLVAPVLISFLSSYMGLELSDEIWPERFDFLSVLSNGLMITLMYLFLNTEELVWRGLVFDRLLDQYGFIKACILLIPIWWFFHIPLFLYPNGHQAGYGLAEFTMIVIAQTFILGWIYIKSKKSLFHVHFHHQLINGFGQAFPLFPVFINGNKYPIWIFCLLLLLLASFLLSKASFKTKE